nr:hypothetical protein [Gammaproteobacteria bacterium]
MLGAAHHSFAIYDMQTEYTFEGVVETLKFRNPHMALTLVETKDGERRVINFVEGAPANMLVRMGFDPAHIQPGKRIKAIGSPRKDDPNAYFLKTIILEDGTRFDTLGPGGQERR